MFRNRSIGNIFHYSENVEEFHFLFVQTDIYSVIRLFPFSLVVSTAIGQMFWFILGFRLKVYYIFSISKSTYKFRKLQSNLKANNS